jgi:hypothetical protein
MNTLQKNIFVALCLQLLLFVTSPASAAPAVSIDVSGPETSSADDHVSFDIEVHNDGQDAGRVVLRSTLSDGLVYVDHENHLEQCVSVSDDQFSVNGNVITMGTYILEPQCSFTIALDTSIGENMCSATLEYNVSIDVAYDEWLCSYDSVCPNSSGYTCLVESLDRFNICSGVYCTRDATAAHDACFTQERITLCAQLPSESSTDCLEDLRATCYDAAREAADACVTGSDVPQQTIVDVDADTSSRGVNVVCVAELAPEPEEGYDGEGDTMENIQSIVEENLVEEAGSVETATILSAPLACTQHADIRGSIWNDQNADGNIDSDEGGIAKVTVALINQDGTVYAQDDTNTKGEFSFENIAPGRYTIDVDQGDNQLDGMIQTYEPDHNLNGKDQIVVKCDNDHTGTDFGYTSQESAPVGVVERPQLLAKTGGQTLWKHVMSWFRGAL